MALARCELRQISKWAGLRTRHPPAWGKNPAPTLSPTFFPAFAEGFGKFRSAPLEKHRMAEAHGAGPRGFIFAGWWLWGCGMRRKLTGGPTAAPGAVSEF
jgi:hypothetical protein